MKRRSSGVVFLLFSAILILGFAAAAIAHPGHRHSFGHNAPEIDPSLISGGVAVLIGGALLVLERYRRR